eukprot:354150-Chlamydomonas_euryale.AAC.5
MGQLPLPGAAWAAARQRPTPQCTTASPLLDQSRSARRSACQQHRNGCPSCCMRTRGRRMVCVLPGVVATSSAAPHKNSPNPTHPPIVRCRLSLVPSTSAAANPLSLLPPSPRSRDADTQR